MFDDGGGGRAQDYVAGRSPDLGPNDFTFAAFLPAPEKIICVGVNYHNRNEEYRDGSELPKYPSLFFRSPTSFTGHDHPLVRPQESDQLDYEGEIANRPGKPPMDEYYERVCVENNGGFGQVATSQAR